VLDALAAAGARATFFLVGEQVRRSPTLARELVDAGHAVALHGDTHRVQLRLTPRALADDLDRGHATIAEATGGAPRCYRPPLGVFSPAGLSLVRRRGWEPLLWSRWGHDWRLHRTPAQIAAELTGRLAPGDVLLLHDADDYSHPGSWQRTVKALPRILDEIARRGLAAATL
jgi:peptidoglycan/xylan/chitin deacetylase (PgdA/CDA1 family)